MNFTESRRFVRLQIVTTALGLFGGLGASVASDDALAVVLWIAATVLVLAPTTLDALIQLARRRAGVDVIAILAWRGRYCTGSTSPGQWSRSCSPPRAPPR